MAYINFQPRPKIPPIGFFQPISADPRDMMTDVEFLLGILKKLNEVIGELNIVSGQIDKISELEAEVQAMRDELSQFESTVNETITTRFNEIVTELNATIATVITQCNAYSDVKAAQLEAQIQEIVLGQITVYDPTTGQREDLQTVINNLFDSGRDEALTATEYDELDDGEPLTATAYDAYELTALAYDTQGKTLLV